MAYDISYVILCLAVVRTVERRGVCRALDIYLREAIMGYDVNLISYIFVGTSCELLRAGGYILLQAFTRQKPLWCMTIALYCCGRTLCVLSNEGCVYCGKVDTSYLPEKNHYGV